MRIRKFTRHFLEQLLRGRGIGSQLMEKVESSARADGIKRVLLNTYSFQAPDFYRKLGYTEIARISPCFGEYSQFFFEKIL